MEVVENLWNILIFKCHFGSQISDSESLKHVYIEQMKPNSQEKVTLITVAKFSRKSYFDYSLQLQSMKGES